MAETAKLDWFPVKGGVSKQYSPNIMLGIPNPDFQRDIKVLQGSSVQAFIDHTIKNDTKSRCIDAVCLRAMPGSSTGHYVMNVATGREVSTQRVTQIPITPLFIKAVEALAKKEGMTQVKIENKFRKIIYHNDATPGVDYIDNTYDSESDSDDEDDEPFDVDAASDDEADEDSDGDNIPMDPNEIEDLLDDDDDDDSLADIPALIPGRGTAAR